MNSNNPLNPFWRVEIRTPEQARIYNRLLIAKIAVQVILLLGLLALGGWTWPQLLAIVAIATVWQGVSFMRRRRQRSR
jgi:hypothetical protein